MKNEKNETSGCTRIKNCVRQKKAQPKLNPCHGIQPETGFMNDFIQVYVGRG